MVTSLAKQTPPARRGAGEKRPGISWGLVLAFPYCIAVTLFSLGPALVAVVFSFSQFKGGRPSLFAAGLQNFERVLADPAFLRSYQNVFSFSLLATAAGFVGSVGIALLLALTRDRPGTVGRTILFLPGSINSATVGLIFIFMMDPLTSPFGFVLRALGWHATTDYVSSSNAFVVMTVLRFYVSAGGWIAIFYSALESVSQELIEAGRIDGCGPWQVAWLIRRPIIMGFVWFMVIQLIAYNMQIFAEPYIISTALGGASFIDPYWSPNMLGAFYTLRLGDLGMSAVVSLSQALISISASIFIVTKTGAFVTDLDG